MFANATGVTITTMKFLLGKVSMLIVLMPVIFAVVSRTRSYKSVSRDSKVHGPEEFRGEHTNCLSC